MNIEQQAATILIVDDNPANVRLLASLLAGDGYRVRVAINGKMALESVATEQPDLILLDIRLPDLDGFAVCRQLKGSEDSSNIPVIFISALNEADEKVNAFANGGIDYITKPFHAEEVLARVGTHVSLDRMRRRLSESRDQLEERVRERTTALERVNRAYRALSRCNRAINRAEKEEQLIGEIVALIHEDGDYISSWIALRHPARSGNSEAEWQLAAQAGAACPCQSEHSPLGELERYYQSGGGRIAPTSTDCGLLATPFSAGEKVEGILGLCSERIDSLIDDEIELIRELAEGLAHGLLRLQERARRRRAEQALAESNLRFQTVLDSIDASIVVIDLESGGQLFANRCFNDLVDNGSITLWVKGESQRTELATRRSRVVDAGGRPAGVVVSELHDQQEDRWYAIRERAIEWLDGRTVLLEVATDISEMKRIEAQALLAREEADSANRAKSEFLATMSHEIRTPMNAIVGVADLLLDQQLGDGVEHYLLLLNNAGNTLLELINDILDLSRVESEQFTLQYELFSPRSVVEGVVEILAPRAREKQLELMCDLRPGIPPQVVGDAARLRQILLNLVNNAIKFTDDGHVLIRVDAGEGFPDYGTLHFLVSDTGIGIAAGQQERIFDPFTQADSSITRRFGGTGLGLAISRRLIECMGGAVAVESLEGEGSQFRFTIQYRIATPDANPQPFSLARLCPVESLREVLLFSECPTHSAILLRTLEWAGLQPRPIASSQLNQILAHANWPLLILDCRPGGELSQRFSYYLQRKTDDRPPLLVLGYDPDHRAMTTARENGIEYLLKPVRDSQLLARVAEMLGFRNEEEQVNRPGVTENRDVIGAHILVAEDSSDNTTLLIAYLKGTPHKATFVEDGSEALASFRKQKFDLILMDMQMPIMDGYTAVRRIRVIERNEGRTPLPIVALTAHALAGDADRSLASGCDAHLTKPIKRRELLDAIERYARSPSDSG